MPRRGWQLRVEDILEAIAAIDAYVRGLSFEEFQADRRTVDAVVRNLEIIGEAVRHLLADQDDLTGEIPWADIADMRNILIHEYFGVSLSIVWQTITEDLPALKLALERLL